MVYNILVKKACPERGRRGFTLIELLVVIAIIGILTSIVGVFIYNAKNQGNDAGIKQNLIQVRNQAEILAGSGSWSANYGSYGVTSCPDPVGQVSRCLADALDVVICHSRATTLPSFFDDAKMGAYIQTLGNLSGPDYVWCLARLDKWAMSARLKTLWPSSWCVDSTGAGKIGSINGGTGLCS